MVPVGTKLEGGVFQVGWFLNGLPTLVRKTNAAPTQPGVQKLPEEIK